MSVARAVAGARPPAIPADRSAALRLVAFAALATFASLHWAQLVDGAPIGRMLLVVGTITAAAASLVAVRRLRLPRVATWVVGLATIALATTLALAAVGVSVRLLWPAGWDELGANVDRGLAGLAGDIDYPYSGANEWSRLALLAAAPLALALAAALAFWPAAERAGRRLRVAALVVLVALFTAAVAMHPLGGAIPRGMLLFALVAAWVWLPTIRARDGALVAGTLLAVAGLAIPVARGLDGEDPWIDYTEWRWAKPGGVAYRWNHSYGPLDWPRDGTTMLEVAGERALYWKAQVLDRFDGVRWTRSEGAGLSTRPLAAPGDGLDLPEGADRRWLERIEVEVGELRSEFMIGAGTPLAVRGLEDVSASADGTVQIHGDPLRDGDAYAVTAYVPNPSASEMRAASGPYAESLARYTQIDVPVSPAIRNAGGTSTLLTETVTVPLRGGSATQSPADRRLASSPYAEVYDLAGNLADPAPTTYEAVRTIETYLRGGFAYSENPPKRGFPLAAFLFDDRIGYCQQFSGAMALMLRMVGIPARVVSGFAPGSEDRRAGTFTVEDFDAHSWVEVYFNEIGWVTFDPTPAAAPTAERPAAVQDSGGAAGANESPSGDANRDAADRARSGSGDGSSGDGDAWAIVGPAGLLLALAGAGVVAIRRLRFLRLGPAVAAEAQLRELTPALDRFGIRLPRGATLLAIEKRLRRKGSTAGARYTGALRTARYGADPSGAPGLRERAALRRELGRSRGIGGRLRALVALPPGGPRRH